MKILIAFLCLFITIDDKVNCMTFYENSLPTEINALVEKKQEDSEYYTVEVKSKSDGKIVKLLFLKNSTGKEIYNFIKEGSHIKKRKGQLQISALTPTADGGFQGQLFPDLCR